MVGFDGYVGLQMTLRALGKGRWTNLNWNRKARVGLVVRGFKVDNDFVRNLNQGARERVMRILKMI